VLAVAAVVCASVALAKEWGPGDLRVCDAKQCRPIWDRGAARAFSNFYWGDGRATRARAPRRSARAYALRFTDDGDPAGLVGGMRLDRALVYGLNCGKFKRGQWYRLPNRARQAVDRLATTLQPMRVPRQLPRSC
jgi:hypothetical protein